MDTEQKLDMYIFRNKIFYYDLQARHYFYLNNGGWSVSVAVPTPFYSY